MPTSSIPSLTRVPLRAETEGGDADRSDRPRPGRTPAALACLLGAGLAGCSGGGAGAPSSPAGDAGGLADLTVTLVSIAPTQLDAGGDVHVIDVVRNEGAAATPTFRVGVHLSQDVVLGPEDILIGTRIVGPLAAGSESQGSGFLTVPTNVAAGPWHVLVTADLDGAVPQSDESDDTRLAEEILWVSVPPLPDLAPVQLALSEHQVEAGQSIALSETVQNVGSGASGPLQVGVYLSPDAQVSPGDLLLAVRNVAGLGPGELSLANDTIVIPAATPAGSWHVGVIADPSAVVPESAEANNVLVDPLPLVVTAPPRPDLVPTELTLGQTTVEAGEPVSFTDAVANQGLADAGPFTVGLFLSTDAQVDLSDLRVGWRALAGLAVGETSTSTAQLVLPTDVPAGLYTVGLVADDSDTVVETSEGNNTIVAAGLLEVTAPPLPDVTPVSLSFAPSVVEAGGTITIADEVTNQGVVAAPPFHIGIYLSSNEVLSVSDVLVGERWVEGLAVGATSQAITEVTLAPGLTSGTWYVGVIVDDVAAVPETGEGDNALLAGGTLDVVSGPDPRPDLIVENLSFSPAQIQPGQPLTIANTLRNVGTLSSGGFRVGFYLSDDETVTSEDLLIGTRTLFDLPIGFGSAQSFPYTLPADLPTGFYTLGAIADDLDEVVESNEDNNLRVVPGLLEVFVPPPPAADLVVASVSVAPTSLAPGEELTIDDQVRNDGDLAAPAFLVTYLLSQDENDSSDDLVLGTRVVQPLEAGGSSTGTVALAVPLGTIPGTWQVLAVADRDDLVSESDESQNALAAPEPVEVTP